MEACLKKGFSTCESAGLYLCFLAPEFCHFSPSGLWVHFEGMKSQQSWSSWHGESGPVLLF